MARIYTVTIDASGLTEEEVLDIAREDAAHFFQVEPSQVRAEVLNWDIGGTAVVRVDRHSGTLIG